MLDVKILSMGNAERYALRRLVVAAEYDLLALHPHLQVKISENNEAVEIGKYARVLVLPTLVINEKVVCSGRYPSREEVVRWMCESVYKDE